MNKLTWLVVTTASLLVLSGCGSLNPTGITCSVSSSRISCGFDETQAQDLPTSSEAKDEKPDRPLTQSLFRFKEAAS